MYRVVIGFNVRLEVGETLRKGAGKVQKVGTGGGSEWEEARFEAGERVEKLPKLADVAYLVGCGALIQEKGAEVKDE
jgi:hypothetical protein